MARSVTSLLTKIELYSYRNTANPKLNRMAFRSLVGSLATLTTSVANLTVLMVLRGEPGWICLMCCNADILFCVLVLHWVTSKDKPSSYASTHASHASKLDASQSKRGTPHRHSMAPGAAPVPPNSTSGYNNSNSRASKHGTIVQTVETPHNDLSIWPYDHSPTSPVAAKLPGSVTTEIRSSHVHHASTRGRLHKSRNDDDDDSECGDEVALHTIHVQREVCIDSKSNSSGERGSESGLRSPGRTESVEDAWGMGRSVSAEKMV